MRDSSTTWRASAGGEAERYLRTLQVANRARPTMWSIRPHTQAAIRRMAPADSGHPWASSLAVSPARGTWMRLVQPEVGGIFNSKFPYGLNDGPLWAGRGLTVTASAGVEGAIGPVTFRLVPEFFRAQNASFPILPNGETGPQAFADARTPIGIDLPQRFGDRAYGRLDPGQSSISLDLGRITLGASTANEYWGPAGESPFLLGNNAAGFAHLFAGTDGPVALGPLVMNARVIAGRLDQSDYSVAPPEASRRRLAGIVVAMGVRQIPNLEVGVARIFETVETDESGGLSELLRPLVEGLLKSGRARATGGQGTDSANQLASVFARWVFPASGVEVFGEIGREDHSWDLRDFLVEPDHDLGYMLGLQRVWSRPGGDLLGLRAELLNTALTHLSQVRLQSPAYIHYPIVQGHTQRGQALGAAGGYGGGAATLALDWWTGRGRRTVSWSRIARQPMEEQGVGVRDLVHAVTVDWLIFGGRVDMSPEATVAYNLNRNRQGDAVNFRVAMRGALHW